jgi:hypothetical protein
MHVSEMVRLILLPHFEKILAPPCRLVLALGAEMKMTFVAGAKENALPFSTLEDAQVRESSSHPSYSPRRLSPCCVLFSEHVN